VTSGGCAYDQMTLSSAEAHRAAWNRHLLFPQQDEGEDQGLTVKWE